MGAETGSISEPRAQTEEKRRNKKCGKEQSTERGSKFQQSGSSQITRGQIIHFPGDVIGALTGTTQQRLWLGKAHQSRDLGGRENSSRPFFTFKVHLYAYHPAVLLTLGQLKNGGLISVL